MRRALALAALGLALPGCAALEYYAQAVGGHLDILARSRPIQEALRDPALAQSLRRKLERVLAMRDFASRELALPDNASYRSYAELERAFAVWNVVAAPEFSVQPVESCFPVAGCVSYRGFFREADAVAHAESLRRKGLDVHVGGVAAYSTLGWFDDPVLSTFIRFPDAELARLVFHELAHQVVYARGDTEFNEAFAVVVEEEGVRRWLARHGSGAESSAYEAQQRRRAEFIGLVLRYRELLAVFYEQPHAEAERRAGKARHFARMLEDYRALKSRWEGFPGYDRFFDRPPNNALLASVSAYTRYLPALRALLDEKGGDLPAFYEEARQLARLGRPQRHARLDALAGR